MNLKKIGCMPVQKDCIIQGGASKRLAILKYGESAFSFGGGIGSGIRPPCIMQGSNPGELEFCNPEGASRAMDSP
jgi:hypothetical protein